MLERRPLPRDPLRWSRYFRHSFVFLWAILLDGSLRVSKLKCGLIQMGLKGDVSMGPEKIRDRMIEAHLPLIDKAGAAGVQVLCFQEIFTQPYFCPSQDRKWYAAAEAVPDGYTTQAHAGVREEVPHGDGGSGLRGSHDRRVLQHRRRHRCRRQVPRQVSKDAHSAGRSGLLREVLLQARRPRLSRCSRPRT